MRFFFTILVIAFLGGAFCTNNKKDTENNEKSISRDSIAVNNQMNWFVRKFSLPYNNSLITDSNSLLFYRTGHFDTSFLINIKKQDSLFFCTYYETLPTNHRRVDDYLDETSKLICFDGYSFQINDSIWHKLVKEITPEMMQRDSSINDVACADCKLYFLSYNFTMRGSNNRERFQKFADFIQGELIMPFRKKRH
ncbi:MAG: hypothetical protein KF746_27215 [Chitinophagaceae bacterium]|nr:hypothetical protein [Chitinophagaceae bacterium]